MNESDDDLLESSEDDDEEDDDDDHVADSHQRMPEAGVPARGQPKDSLTSGSGALSDSNGDGARGGSKGKRDVPTRTSGERPSVASQMREMEGRPSQEDDPAMDDTAGTGGSLKNNGEHGSSGDFVREYMVSAGSCSTVGAHQRTVEIAESFNTCAIGTPELMACLDEVGFVLRSLRLPLLPPPSSLACHCHDHVPVAGKRPRWRWNWTPHPSGRVSRKWESPSRRRKWKNCKRSVLWIKTGTWLLRNGFGTASIHQHDQVRNSLVFLKPFGANSSYRRRVTLFHFAELGPTL